MKLSEIFDFYEVDVNGCWNWTRSTNRGYGVVNYMGRTWGAHRVAYELKKGPIPDGLSVCHSCDNPGCINPDHLFAGTHKRNMQDMFEKGRNGSVKLADSQVVALLRDYINGASIKEIAARYGISAQSVPDFTSGKSRKWLHGKDGCPTLEDLQQAKRSNAVLTESVVREIWRLHLSGQSAADISRAVGFSQAVVYDVCRGRSWRHLPDAPSLKDLKAGGVKRGFNQFSRGGNSRDLHPGTKIPISDLDKILERRKNGETMDAIGETYGVKKAAVSRYLKNHSPCGSRSTAIDRPLE